MLKRRLWGRYCSKEYQENLPSEQFLIIFFHQAKKTYHRYVRFHVNINWCDESVEKKLHDTDAGFSRLFNDIATVQQVFRVHLDSTPHLKKRYASFADLVEEYALGVFDDYGIILSKVVSDLQKRAA